MKDRKEIETEIATLREMKPRIRRASFFGDDHHAAVDAQIDVLQNNRNEDWVWDQASADNVRDAACEAVRWRDGDGDKPSDGWKELVI